MSQPSAILTAASYDHTIRFWEAKSGRCYHTILYPDTRVNRLEITPDKHFLAAAGNPHIRLFDVSSNSPQSKNQSSLESLSTLQSHFQQPTFCLEVKERQEAPKAYLVHQPLLLRAANDLVRQLHRPVYRNQKFKFWLSYSEIYGGELYDLLGDRKKLLMREDGRQQVCIVGLQEFEVSDVQISLITHSSSHSKRRRDGSNQA
ncbi:hypothetical protein KIW84_024225 [Lathyrus oleraceus]|uniref:Kinesin motor domain-containing protein n=1 Tax=Pisum sativum TaxID=3888 RepID=A0A9D5B7G3_PEA|nr:hypothetical protein KIW84_024225 [Pisum sativum]